LDEDKLEQLQRWGAGLAAVDDQELRATGKAILLLIEEIEALHVELWNAKTAAALAEEADRDTVDEPDVSLDGTLAARLRRLGRRSAGDRARDVSTG
jgi:histone H3/H4